MLKLFTEIITPLFLITVMIQGCDDKEVFKKINPAFSVYISAFTSGVISSESTIRIKLSDQYKKETTSGEELKSSLFDFEPHIDGKAYWADDRTIEFRPDHAMPSGTIFNVKFLLSKLIYTPDELKTFVFQFQTIRQSFNFNKDGLKTYNKYNLQWNKLLGSIITADVIDGNKVEKILSANQNGKMLNISWEHDADRRQHKFQIDSIVRKEVAGIVLVSWDGSEIGIDKKGADTIEIPALGDFKLMDVKVVQQPEQFVLLQFSDPLQEGQNLEGLIKIENLTGLKFIVEDNEIRVYTPKRQSGDRKIIAEPGIRNILDYSSQERQVIEITFEDIKPAVRLIGQGVILPRSNGLIFPFEAVNLSAIDVRIVKIFENNVAQFLQVNQLDGNSELKRVGRLVKKETVTLTSGSAIDYGKWNAFSIDLSKLIEADPGAIYKIELGFKKQYSLYTCQGEGDSEMKELEEEDWDENNEAEQSYWDFTENYYDDYYYNDYYYDDYDYKERDNPCHASYYGTRNSVSRNVLASDLGIIAKSGNNKSMAFWVTDLLNSEPISGVNLEIYNFQQQLLGTANTNGKGMAEIEMAKKPFLLVAKKGNQRGYLRLDDGSSLSLSQFDVSGEVVQKGIKGYLYGERGVWRPGDSLYVVFILEDDEALLPKNHPVSFELANPQGQITYKTISNAGVNGFYNFSASTNPDAPTGNWTASVKVGGASFSKRIKIEAIKPNRLKINIDFGVEKLQVSQSGVKGELSAKWLHGAIAKNLNAKIAVTLAQTTTSFKKYDEYVFDDPARKFSSEEQLIFDGRTDAAGKAVVSADISVKDAAPGMLKANFVCRVFEESGDFSIDRFSIPYAPYQSFVGIKTPEGDKRGMLLTDTNHIIQVVTVDADGKPVSMDGLEVKVYKVGWRWWWDASEDNLASYVGRSYDKLLHEEVISTKNGKGSFKLRIDYPDWGRYLIRICDPAGGHCTGKTVYVDWPGWAGRGKRDNPEGASILSFSSDKEKYSVGEFATINFPSGGVGRALVSIESGSRIIDAYWVKPQKGETTFNFKITGQMAPNVYVNLTLVQPHAQTANDLPIRLYGMIPVMVEDPATKLQPEIYMPDVLIPEQEVSVKIKEKEGKAMTYTIAVVDEGLLDLTRFTTPDPWSSFYAREALGVKTWDMYDLVLGAYGGKLEKMFSIGGDESAIGKVEKKAERFKPMVKFMGPFELKRKSSNTHTFMMPRYIGSVRTMIIAGQDEAYGSVEKTTPVRKPLMVLATLPRVVGPGETVTLPVTVFAMENRVKNVSLEVVPNRFFSIKGGNTRNINFTEIGDQVVNFNLEVAERPGIGKIKVIAKSGSEKAEYEIELDVRNPNPKVVNYLDAVVDAGKTYNTEYALAGIEGTNKGTIEISNIPPIDFGRRLKFLIGYPYGCVEQTTSAAFPQLYLADVMELDGKAKTAADKNIKAAMNGLRSLQLTDGGLGFWPNGTQASDWGSSYAGHFMLEAEARGYSLPVGFKTNWIRYQKDAARNWNPIHDPRAQNYYRYNDFVQAYRLYTLALAKTPELGAMNSLREQKSLTTQARWRLAAAYALAGQPEIAAEIANGLNTNVEDYTEMSYSFGSTYRDMAMILETMVLLNKRAEGIPLMKQISEALQSDRWMSTQTTAYCLIAMSKFSGEKGKSKKMVFNYGINGKKSEKITSFRPVYQVEMPVKGTDGGNVEVANSGDGLLYVRITLEGVPATGDKTSSSNNLTMDVVYRDMKGKEINVSKLEQGTDFIAEVSVSNPGLMGNYREMALSQIFPSGWEIHNTRMDEFKSVHTTDIPSYQDFRDDRVYSYFDLGKQKTRTFTILLNASYLGRFYLPTVYCEAMYDNRINARKAGKWVEVVKPGNDELL